MSHLPLSEPDQDDNQNQFLNQHSNTNIIERPHFFFQESSSHMKHSHQPSIEKRQSIGENSLSKVIHNEIDPFGALQSKNDEAKEDNDGQYNQENEFMLDENSLVASINKGLIKEPSEFDGSIVNRTHMLINNSNGSNPFGAESKFDRQNQAYKKVHQNSGDNFMAIKSNQIQGKSEKSKGRLGQQSNQLIKQSKQSKIQQKSQQKNQEIGAQEEFYGQQSLNESNPLNQLYSGKGLIEVQRQESKPIQFLNNSFSKEEDPSKDHQILHQSNQDIGLLNDFSQNHQKDQHREQVQPASKAISNPFHEIEQIGQLSSNILNQSKNESRRDIDSQTNKLHNLSKEPSINQSQRVPSSMKKARRKGSKIISQDILRNMNSGQVHYSSVIKRIQSHNLSLEDHSIAKKKNHYSQDLEQIQESNGLLESKVVTFSRQKIGQNSQVKPHNQQINEADLGADLLDSKIQLHPQQPTSHLIVQDQQELIKLSARVLQPLEQKQASLRKSQAQNFYQRKVSAQCSQANSEDETIKKLDQNYISNEIKSQKMSSNQLFPNKSGISVKKSVSSLKQQKSRSKEQQSSLKQQQSSLKERQISLKEQQSRSKEQYSSLKEQQSSLKEKQIKSNINLIKQGTDQNNFGQCQLADHFQIQLGKFEAQKQSNKSIIIVGDSKIHKPEQPHLFHQSSNKSNMVLQKSRQNQAIQIPQKSKLQSKEQINAYQQGNSINHYVQQRNNVENNNQIKHQPNLQSQRLLFGEPTTNYKIVSVTEQAQHATFSDMEIQSKNQYKTALETKERISSLKDDKIGKQKYFGKPHIYNTFTENTELINIQALQANKKEEEHQQENYEKQHVITPYSHAKLTPILGQKVLSLKDKQYHTLKKRDKLVIQEQDQKQSQIQRLRLLKQAHKKRLERQLQKVRKQLEEINYKQKKMDRIYEQKQRLQLEEKPQRNEGKHLSRNQQRYKRQSEDVMKMVKEHKLEKQQEQIEFQDIDRNITNNLMELSRIRQQAQQKLKEKKRMEIADRMKKKQIQKMAQIKQMKANQQYIQQFKSAEPKYEQKVKSPNKEASNDLFYYEDKRKSNESQNQLIPSSTKNQGRVGKQQQKSGKMIKLRSIGKKNDQDRYENRLN